MKMHFAITETAGRSIDTRQSVEILAVEKSVCGLELNSFGAIELKDSVVCEPYTLYSSPAMVRHYWSS